jgi:hypothetical protein
MRAVSDSTWNVCGMSHGSDTIEPVSAKTVSAALRPEAESPADRCLSEKLRTGVTGSSRTCGAATTNSASRPDTCVYVSRLSSMNSPQQSDQTPEAKGAEPRPRSTNAPLPVRPTRRPATTDLTGPPCERAQSGLAEDSLPWSPN